MKNFSRDDQLLSLCGLNCGLCPMHLGGYCPGCGGGKGNQSCPIARCSLLHGGISYCFQCESYPCGRYTEADGYDSFITRRHQQADLKKAAEIGLRAYHAEQLEKIEILRELLSNYNDGRKKSFFCLAVNLLEISEIRHIMQRLAEWEELASTPIKERAARAAELFQEAAGRSGVVLKLHKKPRAK